MDYNQNNPYQQQNYNPNSQGRPIRNPGQTLATVSMIFGILSIFTVFGVYPPFICGSIAIVLAILSKGYGKKMLSIAKAGIITAASGMAMVCMVFGLIISITIGFFSTLTGEQMIAFGKYMDDQIESQLGWETEDLAGTSYEDIMRTYADLMGK